jgi:hypothetical protein
MLLEALEPRQVMATVSGIVYEDVNGNGVFGVGESPLEGLTVYHDANNNNALDASEASVVSAIDGTYTLTIPNSSSVKIRQVPVAEWNITQPSSGVYTLNASAGQNFTNKHFGNQQFGGQIQGFKFNDLDGNGTQDPGESGLAGFTFFVDINQDGKIGIHEPAAKSDALGNFLIEGVRPGTGYQVREVFQPGWEQIAPSTATDGGAITGVDVIRNQTTVLATGFANRAAFDYGDAPASYQTLAVDDGPVHGILFDFSLTATPTLSTDIADAELDGQLAVDGVSDNTVGVNDENGVISAALLNALVPGSTVTNFQVGVRTGVNPPGKLQGWIDFDGSGTFDDDEQIFKDLTLRTGIHSLSFNVPATVTLGPTNARFRYGYETGLKAFGKSLAGEVEDYGASILGTVPVANGEDLPLPGDPPIRLGETTAIDFSDLLMNDVGTINGPAQLYAPDFPLSDINGTGGVLRFNNVNEPNPGDAANTRLIYVPGPSSSTVTPDEFQYRVTDGTVISNFATVRIFLTASDPIAVDDLAFKTPNTAVSVDVLANDTFPPGTTIKSAVFLSGPSGSMMTVNATTQQLDFTPPAGGVQGSFQYQYTIGATGFSDVSAIVTVQVSSTDQTPPTGANGAAATIFAQYYPDVAGAPGSTPITTVNATAGFFWVRIFSRDLNTLATIVGPPQVVDPTEGVVATYVDLLFDGALVAPVVVAGSSPEFDIVYDTNYSLAPLDDANLSSPGYVNEIGSTYGDPTAPTQPPPPGNNVNVPVMFVKFRIVSAGTATVQPDHAEAPGTGILIANPNADISQPGVLNPTPVADTQVFLPRAPVLTILPLVLEGEAPLFTNLQNAFDVNADTRVNAGDILAVANDIVANGAHPLTQLSIAMSGSVPTAYLDTNRDSYINALDILGIANYIIASSAGPSGGEGESIGAVTLPAASAPSSATPAVAEVAATKAAATDKAVVALVAPAIGSPASNATTSGKTAVASAGVASPRLVVDPPYSPKKADGSAGVSTTNGRNQNDAVDAFFANLDLKAGQSRLRHLARRR